MIELKKSWSVLWTLVLSLAVAFLIAGLFNGLMLTPMAYWLLPVLAAVFALLWFFREVRGRGTSVKQVLGVVFCVTITVVLGYGLFSAVSYLVTLAIRGGVGTSFPWYSGFAFGFYFTWPVLLITGGLWIFLHLREKQENVKDVKLLFFLLLVGTGLWAALWTAERIIRCLSYPDFSPHPWQATFTFTVLYFGPWMGLEGGIYAWLCHRAKNLKPPVQSQPQPDPTVKPAPQPKTLNWMHLLGDALVAVVPLAVVAVAVAVLWNTRYLAQNIAMVLCTAGSIVVLNLLTGWLIGHHFADSRRLGYLAAVNAIMIPLTLIAAFFWMESFAAKQLQAITRLPEGVEKLLALGYFGPLVLGQIISVVLLLRQSRRTPGTEKPGRLFILLLAVILVLNCGFQYVLFQQAEYWTEAEAYVGKVYINKTGDIEQLRVKLVSQYPIAGFYDTEHFITEDGLTLCIDLGTRWSPNRSIDTKSVDCGTYHLDPLENVRYIAVYIPGRGYVTMMEKDQETGQWVKTK